MNIVSTKKITKLSERRKYFKKKKDGFKRLEESLDYYLLKKVYGDKSLDKRIEDILKTCDSDLSDRQEQILKRVKSVYTNNDMTKKEKVDVILSEIALL